MKLGLPAKLHPIVHEFLDSDVIGKIGTPANLVFPQVFVENLAILRSVLERYSFGHRICYAHKVNQSTALVRAGEHAGIGIDVASPGELAHALYCGVGPDRIEATGPKGRAFLADLVRLGVTINVDNLWELERIAELATDPAPVLLRLSGESSRFGIPATQTDRALDLLGKYRDALDFRGMSFHLDSGEVRDRLSAVDTCFVLIERAYSRGLQPSVIDIGGGFRQVFSADVDAFDRYVRALRDGLIGCGESMSWSGNTFGYRIDGGTVSGTPIFHKYGNATPATALLDDLLNSSLGGRSIAQLLADNLLELWMEPGKAMVDHAGITLAGVEFVKETADGTVLVNLDISRDAITPADQEVMVDPVLVGSGGGTPVGVYFAGSLCLERDMITNHKVWLPRLPDPGDVIAFPNTAAYHMDLSAGTASMRPAVPKFAVTAQEGGFTVCPDSEYRP